MIARVNMKEKNRPALGLGLGFILYPFFHIDPRAIGLQTVAAASKTFRNYASAAVTDIGASLVGWYIMQCLTLLLRTPNEPDTISAVTNTKT